MTSEIPETTSLRAVIDRPGGGRCLMSGFPGLQTSKGQPDVIDPEAAQRTVAAITANGADLLIVLAEQFDLPDTAFDVLRQAADKARLTLEFLPIRDYHAPDQATEEAWNNIAGRHSRQIGPGGTVAFNCRHGAGRSGLMAAFILLRDGMSLDQAVTTVRQHFSEAIETEVQMNWLRQVSSRLKDDSQTLDVDSGATHS